MHAGNHPSVFNDGNVNIEMPGQERLGWKVIRSHREPPSLSSKQEHIWLILHIRSRAELRQKIVFPEIMTTLIGNAADSEDHALSQPGSLVAICDGRIVGTFWADVNNMFRKHEHHMSSTIAVFKMEAAESISDMELKTMIDLFAEEVRNAILEGWITHIDAVSTASISTFYPQKESAAQIDTSTRIDLAIRSGLKDYAKALGILLKN